MFDTEELVAIPLPSFTHRPPEHILGLTAVLPMRKVYVRDGKSRTIIDVDKLSQTLGGELSLNYGQFMEAAMNFFKFQSSRDKDKSLSCNEGSQNLTVEHTTWTESWRRH